MIPHPLPSVGRRAGLGIVALLALLALVPAACDPVRPPAAADPPAPTPSAADASAAAPVPADPRDAGRRLVTQAFGVLSSNLNAAIGRTGPAGALEFCSVNVAPLTASIAPSNRVELRRVTHKARNPANRATEAELALIEEYRRGLAAGRTNPPVVVTNTAGTVTFYSPIVLGNPLCLQCHGTPGTEIVPDTLQVIDRLYPADQARGFRLQELRGLWAVTFR